MHALKSTRLVRLADLVGNPRALPPIPGIVPLSAATIWRKVSQNQFPRPLKLGPNSTAWLLSEVEQWVLERMEARE